jgi:hypothetical protein
MMTRQDQQHTVHPQPQPQPQQDSGRPAKPDVEEIRRQLGWDLVGATQRQPAP